MSTPVVTQADLEKTAEELGEKTGFLLSVAPWPNEVKSAWVYLLDHMTTEEITEFSEILEFMFADAMTQELDKEFEKQVEALRKSNAPAHEEKTKQLDALYTRIRQRIAQ